MLDLNWLSTQARGIHDVFMGLFFAFATILLVIGVIAEHLKMPFTPGGDVTHLVGRVFIAAFLLYAYPEITNALAEFTDALSKRIGDFNDFHLVLSKMGDKLGTLAWSWTSVKDSIILLFSFLTFFLLYISVFIASAGVVYCWLLLYIFSPVLIALFILPVTSFATKTLFRALIEVSAWKVVWATLATLLWSSALGHMNDDGSKLNFLTVIAYNLILAISLLLTPFVVNALASKGIAQATSGWLGLAAGATVFSPGVLAKAAATHSTSASGGLLSAGAQKLGNRFQSSPRDSKKNASRASQAKRTQAGSSKATQAPNAQTAAQHPSPPAWHGRVPAPNQPPPWIQRRLDRERGQASTTRTPPERTKP